MMTYIPWWRLPQIMQNIWNYIILPEIHLFDIEFITYYDLLTMAFISLRYVSVLNRVTRLPDQCTCTQLCC